MLPFKKILFPVDLSEQSRGAARYVEAIAGRFNAPVTLLNASDPQYNDLLLDNPVRRRERLDTFLGEDFEYLKVERVLTAGDPATSIVSFANEGHFDLIMMPTHGLGGFRRFLLGSVTAKVLHDADCPVWTGVHLEKAPPLEKIVFRNFLCAVNLDPHSKLVIDCATELADEYRAALTVVHVVPLMDDTESIKWQIGEWLGIAAERTTMRIESGEIASTVAVVAAETEADLLVIGRNPASGTFGRLRTDGYSIIRKSPCPVISI
jgi:nucleotide-binding universal stress UspA family protein